jgi:hypothetical protein
MSDLIGVCVYCNSPAVHTCGFCGALVCEKHFDPQGQICTKCKLGKKVE